MLAALATGSIWAGALFQYVSLVERDKRLTALRIDLDAARDFNRATILLARERGLSSGYLHGSNDDLGQLRRLRSETTALLSRFDSTADSKAELTVESQLGGLPSIRRLIDRKAIETEHAFEYYTALIAAMNDSFSSRLAGIMVKAGLPYESMTDLITAVEYFSQIRGQVNGLLGATEITDKQRNALSLRMALFEEYLRQYSDAERVGATSVVQLFESTDFQSVWQIALELSALRSPAELSVTQAQWWESASRLVDQLHKASALQLAQMMNSADAKLSELRSATLLTVIALVVLGILSLSLALSTVGRIVFGMRNLLDGFEAVAHRADFKSRIDERGNDEFSDIASGVNNLLAIAENSLDAHKRDPRTGLHNRAWLLSHLDRLFEELRVTSQRVAAVSLDITDFGKINHLYGHAVGDIVLKQVSARLMSVTRADESIAQVDADEFILLTKNFKTSEELDQRIEQLIECFLQQIEFDQTIVNLDVTAVVTIIPDDAGNSPEVIKNIQIARSQLKAESTKRLITYFTAEQRANAEARLALREEFKGALERHEIQPYWQPIIRLSDGALVAHELLTRWQHPKHGLLFPDRFIEFAEEPGIVERFGETIFRTGVECLAKPLRNSTCRTCFAEHTLCINVSPIQILQPDFVGRILGILDEYGVAPSDVKIEITETSVMEYPDDVVPKLEQLRSRGLKIALDDFGTGYSSLWMISKMPIDYLKMDKSFVDEIGESETNRLIVEMAINMAHTLGLKVIAEGIETNEQLRILRDMGCDEGQGYYFSKPIPVIPCLGQFGVVDSTDFPQSATSKEKVVQLISDNHGSC